MKLAVYEEMGELERRMDDLMRSFLGPRARLTRPVLPLFLPSRSFRLPTSSSVTRTS